VARRATEGDARRATIYRRERSASRVLLPALGGIALIAIVIIAVVSLSSSKGAPGASGSRSAVGGRRASTSTAAGGRIEPRALRVVVLNATQTNGLAAKVAGELKSHGYGQASALFGTPSGSYSTTTVQYAAGHRPEADGVAQALSVASADVKPLEASTAPLAGGAFVVVIVGGEAAEAGGESAHATGEGEAGGETAGGETAGGGEAASEPQAGEPGT
jgi:hypothetical protein